MKLGFRLEKKQFEEAEAVSDVGRSRCAARLGWEPGGDLARVRHWSVLKVKYRGTLIIMMGSVTPLIGANAQSRSCRTGPYKKGVFPCVVHAPGHSKC